MASTSSRTPISAASDSTLPSPTRWDVFLSFRGTDTRYKFTSHLYAALDRQGVRTFKDDPELRSGEVISDALLQAIRNSRSYIVVFSENYASSPWCLDELVEIYNCHTTFSRLVIPVFYNIDPSVVRHQIGSFKEAFEKYEIRFSGETEKVKKWRLALTEVANFSGKHVFENRVKELDDDMSLTLFTQHALGNAEPSSSLMVLTREILGHAGGLPLALAVFGSYLYTQPEEGWKSFIKRLQRIPHSTIQQTLLISLDALESDDPMLKNIFLDIACFLIGSVKKKAVKLLETYYSDADYNIGILKKRCLLDIDDSNRLRMHDLLRDMGREVSRNNSPNEPGKHSRLWEVEVIHDVLKKDKGKDVIEGIIPRSSGDRNPLTGKSLSTKTFKRMDNLRFLLLPDVDITGSFERKLENLRWLCWNGCPLTSFPSEFYPQKLVFLALPHSKLRTMQGLNMVFNNLKDLDMSQSQELTTTPDFTKLPCLETLNLHGCRNLEKVHISIGILVKLVYLNLSRCEKLKSLPGTLCDLRALEVLDLDGCMSLEALPSELGKIESLKKLYMDGNENLRNLPDSICSLRSLETLQITGCKKLKILPEVYSNLERAGMLSGVPDTPDNNQSYYPMPDNYQVYASVEFQWDLYGDEYESSCIIV